METQTDIQNEIQEVKNALQYAQSDAEKQGLQETLDMLEKQVSESETSKPKHEPKFKKGEIFAKGTKNETDYSNIGKKYFDVFTRFLLDFKDKFNIDVVGYDDLKLHITFNNQTHGWLNLTENIQIENYSKEKNTFDRLQEIEYFLQNAINHTDEEINKQFESKAKYWIKTKKTHDTESEVIEAEPIPELQNENIFNNFVANSDVFSNNSFYLKNTDKTLGTIKIEKDRFGKEIEIVQGGFEDLKKVTLDYNFLENNSISDSAINETSIQTNENSIDKIVEKSEKSIVKKSVNKKRQKQELEGVSSDETMTFEEVYKEYNKDISNEELKVFIWYKEQIGQPLNSRWKSLIEDVFYDNEWITEMIKKGLIYYYDGKLLPSYLYLAENIYEKYIALVEQGEKIKAGRDAKHIIETYGQEVYDKQVAKLNEVYTTLYNSRLLVGDSGTSNALKLVPYSDFAKNFTIKTLIDEKEFKVKYYGVKDKLSEIDFFYGGSQWHKKEVPELSLKDAFCYWLAKEYNNITFKKGVSYADIIKIYVNQQQRPRKPNDQMTDAQWKAEWERRKEKVRSEGERLFNIFLVEQLKSEDKIAIEFSWNKSYNNYVPINYNKIPVALSINKKFEIKPKKRDAIAFMFNQGSGCLAYEVGVGKTPSAAFIIKQYIDSSYSKRPIIVVPNQTYRQWLSELRKFIPDTKINDLYNLRGDYFEELLDENMKVSVVDEGSISVITYEGFEMLGFNEHTEGQIFNELYDILNQGGVEEKMSDKQKEGFFQKLQYLIGRGLKGTMINIEDLGIDFVCFDEAHALKKIFTSVKGEAEDGSTKRGKTPYKINSGTPSGLGLKGFMIAQYILRNNNYRNVLLLTATPFTNSPLEVFSMLALVAYKQLQETDLNNISNFFDNYIEVENQLVVTSTMKAEYRQVVTGFKNITSLQKLIKRFFDFKDASNIKGLAELRPNKIVLPLINKNVDGNIIKLSENERVETFVPLSQLQEGLMKDIILYAEGEIDEKDLLNTANGSQSENEEDDINEDEIKTQVAELTEGTMGEEEKKGVRTIKSIMFSQNLALSPYLYRFSGLKNPDYLQYVNTSPKLKYVMECIKSVKQYHEQHNEEISGQIIYMNRGIQYFNLLKQYLVEIVGYKEHEIGLVFSKMKGGSEAKDDIKNLFLGIKFNKESKTFEKIPDEQRIKIIIGSGTIKEGMNLQMHTTLLYNCFLDWNPTDIIQLHGRLWRQGNEYRNVRIVNPLMVNSVDIFLFQKLEEKTARINAIWNTDNKNSVLKLEELNPSELKFALIKDPKVIAKYQIEDETTQIEDDLASETSLMKKYESIVDNLETLDAYRPNLDKLLTEYRPKKFKPELSDNDKIKMSLELFRTQLDENGLKMVDSWEREDYLKGNKGIKLSPRDGEVSKEYWFDNVAMANRVIEREKRDYFEPRGMDIRFMKKYIYEQNQKLDELDVKLKNVNNEQHIAELVEQIIERKEKEKIKELALLELVDKFKNLNNLLSIKFNDNEVAQEEEFNCLSNNKENGEIKIDNESIERLEECINNQPTTKSLNINSDGEYTEERKALHKKIYEKFASKKVCNDNHQPIAILTGGSPASGKTTFLKKYAPYFISDNIYKIDADEVRAELPEYKGWNSQSTHDETRDIVRNYLLSNENIGQPCKFDLLYDGTMNRAKNYLPLIGRLKELGYKIFIVYMNNIPYEMALKRSLERFKKGDQFGIHRYVPRDVIKDFYSSGKTTLNELKNKVDGFIVVDASNKDYNILEKGGIELPRFDINDKEKMEKSVKTEKSKIKKQIYLDKIEVYEEMVQQIKNSTKKQVYLDKIDIYKEMLTEL